MWKLEKQLVERQQMTNEIYGRYIDDIFMTSNESFTSLNHMLGEANSRHPNIKLVRQMPFLDVLVENQNGLLTTSVYHKAAAEPYIVPFSSDHPRHIFCFYIMGMFLVCEDNNSVKTLSLHPDRYSSRYIDKHIREFFSKYLPFTSHSLVSIIDDENSDNANRSHLLQKSTGLEQQMLSRIASIESAKHPMTTS
ncbi:unnamed protein product [Rotaria socialis]|nr:unnamed protein product [Rotaria socialis]